MAGAGQGELDVFWGCDVLCSFLAGYLVFCGEKAHDTCSGPAVRERAEKVFALSRVAQAEPLRRRSKGLRRASKWEGQSGDRR